MRLHTLAMVRACRATAAVLLCGLLIPAAAQAAGQQSPPLAEVARKEAERRKGIKETQKVITTKDLPESARRSHQAPQGGDTTAAGEGQKPAGDQKAPAGEGSQKDETYWRNRITQARDGLQRGESFLAALQSQVNGLTTDFVNRDDPYQRAKIGEDRQKALAEMERVKADIELFKKQIGDIEEEARKAGVPPGWLR